MTDSLIRIATELDVTSIASIHLRAWKKAYELYIPESILSSLSLAERTQQWFDLIRNGTTILVLETNNQLVGFASICEFRKHDPGYSLGEISAIYLHPDYWRHGFGTKLCVAALAELARQNYKEVLLWVLVDNVQARLFYENLGFQATDEIKLEEFYEGGALLSEILYKKAL